MTTATSVPMISIQGVDKHFGDLHVLKDINLDVPRGQVVVILGPSGSGKSTLCRTINRLEPIDSGTISIDGQVLPEEGRKLAQLRSDVGMVFQSFNLFAHKTILENVALAPIKVRKTDKDKARTEALALLDTMIDLAQSGMTMLVVTHEMGFARRASQRVVFMADGAVVEDAEPERFFTDPQSNRAKDFLGKILNH